MVLVVSLARPLLTDTTLPEREREKDKNIISNHQPTITHHEGEIDHNLSTHTHNAKTPPPNHDYLNEGEILRNSDHNPTTPRESVRGNEKSEREIPMNPAPSREKKSMRHNKRNPTTPR